MRPQKEQANLKSGGFREEGEKMKELQSIERTVGRET